MVVPSASSAYDDPASASAVNRSPPMSPSLPGRQPAAPHRPAQRAHVSARALGPRVPGAVARCQLGIRSRLHPVGRHSHRPIIPGRKAMRIGRRDRHHSRSEPACMSRAARITGGQPCWSEPRTRLSARTGGVRQVGLEPVDGQQPPLAQPRPARVRSGYRLGHALEDLRHHVAAQPLTGLGDAAGGRHAPGRVPAAPVRQRAGDLGRDLLVVVVGDRDIAIVRYATTCVGSLPPDRLSATPQAAIATSITSRGTAATSTPSDT